ncbi:DMT family transporter [Gephyromycinifex aptenodytis]|uniref:DMT family transporter n=1 Tax=Gephyromycinifex aptenodytis TaxID=2716227 RepID=UPI001D02263E|nr:DMT family transporter [Gephyromycinifex aptenodytis]
MNRVDGGVSRAVGNGGGTDLKVVAAAAITVLFWASAFIAIRFAGPHYDPGAMALLRMLIGTLGLGIIAAHQGIKLPPRRDVPLVIAWGVGWFCLYNLALNTAELSIDAGTASMIVNTAPLMVVIFAGLLLGEGFPRALLIGAPISFLGVVLIGSQSPTGHIEPLGLLLAVAAAVLYAGCTLLQKRLLRTVDATTLTWLGAAAGTVALLPWAGRMMRDVGTAPTGATLAVVFLGVFPTAVAFTTWSYVLARSSAGRTSAITYASPAVTILLSWLILAEVPTLVMLIGGALCLLGVFITRMSRSDA